MKNAVLIAAACMCHAVFAQDMEYPKTWGDSRSGPGAAIADGEGGSPIIPGRAARDSASPAPAPNDAHPPLPSAEGKGGDGRSPFDRGVFAYANGDFKAARENLIMHEYSGDAKSRFADFLLATIAAREGDMALAKERFPRAFKNLPENNELVLAQNFSAFADANALFSFEAELLGPFYAGHREFFDEDSMLAWRYARALLETGEKARAAEVLQSMWRNFSADASADGVDAALFNGEASAAMRAFAIPGETAVSKARAALLSGSADGVEIPPDAGLGLLLRLRSLGKKVPQEDFERALEASPDSPFAWRVCYVLAQEAFGEERYELAFGFASRAETLSPDSVADAWKVYVLMGDSLRFMKRYDDARKCYLKVGMDPECQGEAAAEALYKAGLSYYDEKRWAEAYKYFERVFIAYFGFDRWASRAYYYGAKSLLELGNNLGAKNVLREYLKYSEHRDTPIYRSAEALWSNIKL